MPKENLIFDLAREKFKFKDNRVEFPILPLDELFDAQINSPFANSLIERNRFKRRFYFPDQGDTDEVWTRWVEPFTSLIEHQKDFTTWSLAFHQYEGNRFTLEEQTLGIIADAIHDLGETRIEGHEYIGDIPSGLKNTNDEIKEKSIAHTAIDLINFQDDLRPLTEVLHLAYDQVVVGESAKLHHAHKSREKWDYVRTALHLYHLSVNPPNDFFREHKIYSLNWFIARILAYDLPKITTELATEYPASIGHELNRHAESITHAFDLSSRYIDQLLDGSLRVNIDDDYPGLKQRLDNSYQDWLELNLHKSN